jgi:hypothetical protein
MTRWIGSLLVIMAGLNGCGSGGVVNPPDGRIRALNMVSTRASMDFLRVERVEGSLTFKQGTGFIIVDSDTYNFNIEFTAPGAADPTRVVSFPATIEVDRDYTFVITEPTPNNFVVTAFDRDVADGPAGETAIDLMHVATNFGSVDIFIEAPGAPLVGAMPFAPAVSPSNAVLEGTLPAGDYVVSLTPPGNPSMPLFTSTTITLADGDRVFATLADSVGTITADVSILLTSTQANGGQEILDINAPAELRFLHAGSQAGPLDLIIDDDFAMPLHGAVAPESVTSYAGLAAGTHNIKIIPAGDPITIELDQDADTPAGVRTTLLVGGDLGAIAAAQELDDLRPFLGAAKLRLASGAATEGAVNIYIVPPGTDITTESPVVTNFSLGLSPYLQFLPADYEVILTEPGTTNVIGTPVPITMDGSGLYGIVVVDDPATRVRVVLIDDFVP